MPGGRHGKSRPQIGRAVGEKIRQGQLGAGKHHGHIDPRQLKGHGGSGIGHGIGTVGHHDAVKATAIFKNRTGDELPFLRGNVGGIQADHIFHGNVIIGPKLLQLPLHNAAVLGLQPLSPGGTGNGSAGGQQQNVFFHNSSNKQKVSV